MTYRSSLPLVVIAAPLLAAMALGCSGSDSGVAFGEQDRRRLPTRGRDRDARFVGRRHRGAGRASATLGQQAPAGAWDQNRDQAAISSMKDTWARARTAYEHIEGAIAHLIPSWTARSTPGTTINWARPTGKTTISSTAKGSRASTPSSGSCGRTASPRQ